MRTIQRTSRFKRDYKREAKGDHRATLDGDLLAVISLLIHDQALPAKSRDHALSGALKDCRDCHLRPDLVLIYRLSGDDTLELVRLGSHSELSL